MGTVSKALDLLGLFTRARPLIGLSELARLAGVNKATCYRLMGELQSCGLVEQVGSSREYRLGAAVLRLAALREAHVPTREAAMPLLQRLATAIGESVHASQLVAGELRMIAYAYSSAHAMRVMMEDADVLPFHATSSGLVVLAHMTPNARHALLKAPLARFTPLTETDPAAVKGWIDRVRATGIAELAGGYEPDVSSIAVPLFDALGQISGALAVAVPAARMTEAQAQKIRDELAPAGRELTALWGGSQPERWAEQTEGSRA